MHLAEDLNVLFFLNPQPGRIISPVYRAGTIVENVAHQLSANFAWYGRVFHFMIFLCF